MLKSSFFLAERRYSNLNLSSKLYLLDLLVAQALNKKIKY